MADVPEQKSKKPEDTDFKQQRLPAWQPLLTPKWVIITFFAVGIVFLPIGIAIVVSSNSVIEITYRYDHICALNTTCNFNITITDNMDPPIYVYYKLSNYYQNHRRYVKSRSDEQLRGSLTSLGQCTPIERNSNGSIIVPCGLIANSFFNDTFSLARCASGSCSSTVGWTKTGIAWSSDKDYKFVYKALEGGQTSNSLEGYPLPRVDDEELMVWMRTAGLPTFKKLHRIIKSPEKLTKGDVVQLTVKNNYPVSSFDGEKAFVLSTTSWLGGKNDFLGWAYIAVGCLCLALGIAFILKQRISPRRLGDMSYFHWSGGKAVEASE